MPFGSLSLPSLPQLCLGLQWLAERSPSQPLLTHTPLREYVERGLLEHYVPLVAADSEARQKAGLPAPVRKWNTVSTTRFAYFVKFVKFTSVLVFRVLCRGAFFKSVADIYLVSPDYNYITGKKTACSIPSSLLPLPSPPPRRPSHSWDSITLS